MTAESKGRKFPTFENNSKSTIHLPKKYVSDDRKWCNSLNTEKDEDQGDLIHGPSQHY